MSGFLRMATLGFVWNSGRDVDFVRPLVCRGQLMRSARLLRGRRCGRPAADNVDKAFEEVAEEPHRRRVGDGLLRRERYKEGGRKKEGGEGTTAFYRKGEARTKDSSCQTRIRRGGGLKWHEVKRRRTETV